MNAKYNCSIIAIESIEKRPFFHFKPCSKCLSVGLFGCSLKCDFCQNHNISQRIATGEAVTARDIVNYAETENVDGIAFTYNEPTIYWELIKEVGEIKKNLYLAVKSNGYASDHIWNNLLDVDAINIDIKGNDEDYVKHCSGKMGLAPVLKSIEKIAESNTHLEISYLVLPNRVKDVDFHKRIANFISSVSRSIPVHILMFYPMLRMTGIFYDPNELIPVVDIFKEKLDSVYISNVYKSSFLKYRNNAVSGLL